MDAQLMKIGLVTYKYVVPLSFATFLIVKWNTFDGHEARILVCMSILLFVRIENAITLYRYVCKLIRFYLEKSEFEYEITILFSLVKLINSFQLPQENSTQLIVQICEWIFNIFLITNLSCYVITFFLIIFFALSVLVGIFRISNDIRSGLDQEELGQLKRFPWDGTIVQENGCSICLNDFILNEEVVQLPRCLHLFHSECIDQWLAVQPLCPYCRNNIRVALSQ